MYKRQTEGTGVIPDDQIAKLVREHFDLRPKGIVNMLDLLRPIYTKTAAYGHFGRSEPEFSWEATDLSLIHILPFVAVMSHFSLLPPRPGAASGPRASFRSAFLVSAWRRMAFALVLSLITHLDVYKRQEHHLPVLRYVHPDTFAMFEREAYAMGFSHAAVGAMVRSSYHADEQAHAAGVPN